LSAKNLGALDINNILAILLKINGRKSALLKTIFMITRIWHGKTKKEDSENYLRYIKETGLKDYRAVAGNISAKILRRLENDICHFCTVTEWDSTESIKKFAGQDYEKARYYDEDEKYLIEFEEFVTHYETFV
jgi:heme-degrading monooxygenase HmoA